MKPLPEDLKDRIERSKVKNEESYNEAIKTFSLGDRVVYHTEFGWVKVGTTGTVTKSRTGDNLVVTLDGETGDNTYQLSSEFIKHITN